MNRLWQDWWKLALSASEIALNAPQVVQHRTNRLMQVPGLGGARNRREGVRMVAEKWDAGIDGQMAVWQTSLQLQEALIKDFWSAALGQRSARRTAKRAGLRSAQASMLMAQRSLAPVRRRVRANAIRLGFKA